MIFTPYHDAIHAAYAAVEQGQPTIAMTWLGHALRAANRTATANPALAARRRTAVMRAMSYTRRIGPKS